MEKRYGYVRAAVSVLVVVYLVLFGYYTRKKTFWLTYFPNNSYQPASNLPNVDGRGEPKVVMVRKSGQIECFDVLYSRKLKELLEASPSRRVAITYRIRYRLHPFWIETLDVAGLGPEPSSNQSAHLGSYRSGDAGSGECF